MRPQLSSDLLDTIAARAAGYDEHNEFCSQDITDLQRAGYFAALTPSSLDDRGWGLTLPQLLDEQRKLAGAAPATGLAANMHHVWQGVARFLHNRGDHSMDWALREAAEGEIFAFGISEPGNHAVLFDSFTTAEPQTDQLQTDRPQTDETAAYTFTGTKIFTTLSPVWTRLGIFGKDPHTEQLVFGFLDRNAGGFRISDDWDVLGMRATHSRTTFLEQAPVAADRIMHTGEVGPNVEPFVFGIFANFVLLTSSVYSGLARRALQIAGQHIAGGPKAELPLFRAELSRAGMALQASDAQLDSLAQQVETLDSPTLALLPRLSAAKVTAIQAAQDSVQAAIAVVGGQAFGRTHELARLYRDVLAGLFHPTSTQSALDSYADLLIGQ